MRALPKITIYDRYVFQQVLIATVVAILLFIVVWIAPEMLLKTIKKALSGEYDMRTAFLVLACEIPLILGKAFPVGLLLGSLFTFDKLSKDSELTIFRAVGLSFKRILAPVLVLSFIVTGLCFYTCDRLIPAAETKKMEIKDKHPTTQYIYTQKDKNGAPELAVVVSGFRDKIMYDVIVLDFSKKIYSDVHQLSNIYSASIGKYKGKYWELRDIKQYDISSDGIFTAIEHVKKMRILNDETAAKNTYTLMTYSTKKEREINNRDLRKYIKLLKSEEMEEEYNYMLNKYFQRFFHPFMCVLLAIMGTLLGFSKPREQRMIGFAIAIGSIFVYYITLPFFDLLAEKGVLHPLITAIFPPLAFLMCIIIFYKSKDL
ncbi:LptF/LptG family permease [bacterium]|nr:LptF/LptG family permease [bacterium]